MNNEAILRQAYQLFNERKPDELLQLMTADVHWPNGWEGGYVHGRDEVKDYWQRQWKESNPQVVPQSFRHLSPERTEVLVRQTVKDSQGNLLSDGFVKHSYTFRQNLVSEMQIEAAS